ncbi:MAG: hypothetical protein K0R93_2195 [Anaerosolibacter sp.]|jgi:hypothetical protein|uniref:DUF2877 domain-containing protein n=1 Tax=Anaerosolibacter sp. TaxID=1872527 RepID=UPI002620B42B|nr:DUF2877 domain-containing protein [Anaerosolibacter sp.]MDF2547297.1 hypothetical protein [Anaerosolibacter sp.]
MKAMMICANTRELLTTEKEIHGVVHSVFQKVCNIEIQTGEIIPLIAHGMPKVPRCITVKIPTEQTMHSLGFKTRTAVVIHNDLIRTMDRGPQLDFQEAVIWDGKPGFPHMPLEEQYVLENIARLRKIILEKGRLSGLGAILFLADKDLRGMPYPEELQMNTYCEFIGPRIMKLIEQILKGNLREIEDMAKQIIGFGLGLTPSADDLLAGMMTAMIYGDHYYGRELTETLKINQAIIQDAAHRTTKISAEMLLFAAMGEAAENIGQLMKAIFYEKSEKSIYQNAISVIDNGDTSGTDCIAGIYAGCILSQIKAREGGWSV